MITFDSMNLKDRAFKMLVARLLPELAKYFRLRKDCEACHKSISHNLTIDFINYAYKISNSSSKDIITSYDALKTEANHLLKRLKKEPPDTIQVVK